MQVRCTTDMKRRAARPLRGTAPAFAGDHKASEQARKGEWRVMDVLQSVIGDSALLMFSFAGLAATAVAIVRDTRAQKAELSGVRIEG